MIVLDLDQWHDLAEHLLDDSAGPVSVPWSWLHSEIDNVVEIRFDTPQEQTLFLLKYLKEKDVSRN